MHEQFTRPFTPAAMPTSEPRPSSPAADRGFSDEADEIVFESGDRGAVRSPLRPALSRRRLTDPALPRQRKPVQDATLFTLVACMVGAIGIVYLLQTSQVATLGYRASELERERAELTAIHQQLSYDTAMRQALPAIEERARVLGMVPITDMYYLDVPTPLDTELPIPAAEAPTSSSLLDRLTSRFMDTSRASDSDIPLPSPATTEAGTP